jgi:uncharacterized UPF0160 family protein
VPVSSESFESRKALPKEWRGLRDDVLSQTTGVPGCVFVHASGFIGGELLLQSITVYLTDIYLGAQTREGVEALARLALQC